MFYIAKKVEFEIFNAVYNIKKTIINKFNEINKTMMLTTHSLLLLDRISNNLRIKWS